MKIIKIVLLSLVAILVLLVPDILPLPLHTFLLPHPSEVNGPLILLGINPFSSYLIYFYRLSLYILFFTLLIFI